MIETSSLLIFLGAAVLLTLAPGPDIIYLVAQGVSRGAGAGFATAMGLAAGNLVHTVAAALGVSVIFQTSALAFQGLKFAGVAYLLYLAIVALRDQADETEGEATVAPGGDHGHLFWRGFLMNVLNPKVALFFLAFLPQFASPAAGPVWIQMLIYGVLFTLQVVLVFGLIGVFAGKLSTLIDGGHSVARFFKWGIAGLYVALALRLALIEK